MSKLLTSSAGKRVLSLLDDNSFVEIGGEIRARSTDFGQNPDGEAGDGVLTGYGTIDGTCVYVYSQDPDSMGGSIGEMHAKKIVRLYRLARKTGYPVIGLLDSTGMRLIEGVDALEAFGRIYKEMSKASGLIPQITACFGNAGGGMSVLAELSDFTFMENKGKLFVNTPDSIKGNYEDKKDTASASYKAEAGVADCIGTEEEVFSAIRQLVGLLPQNASDEGFNGTTVDDLNRAITNINPDDSALVIRDIADDNAFFEVKAAYAKDMVTGFIRLADATVGVIANRTKVTGEDGKSKETYDSVLTVKGVRKAAEFARFCDAFNIPILTLTNTRGFCACEHAERMIAKEAARLTGAFVCATVPKVNVVIGEAYGSASVIMNSKAIGADYVYAWKSARIGAIDGKHAAEILFGGSSADEKKKNADKYNALQASTEGAANRGYVDTVIEAQDTRKYVIGAFEMLYGKDDKPEKKHSTF